MGIELRLEHLQTRIMSDISSAAARGNFRAVASLGRITEECQSIGEAISSMSNRLQALGESIDGEIVREPGTNLPLAHTLEIAPSRGKRSGKVEGANARREFVANLQEKGVRLTGSRLRYQSGNGKSVWVAFANEQREGREGRWFEGLPDGSPDVVVLLCRRITGLLMAFVIPMPQLASVWPMLARSGGQVKFNIKEDSDRFYLQIPYAQSVDITPHLDNYAPL